MLDTTVCLGSCGYEIAFPNKIEKVSSFRGTVLKVLKGINVLSGINDKTRVQ